MLVRITNRCQMGCSHCMIDAQPDSSHMSVEVFDKVLRFLIDTVYDKLLTISGGEPSEHPELLEFINHASKHFLVIVLTNGSFLRNEDYTSKLMSSRAHFQLTYDERYYPKPVVSAREGVLYFGLEGLKYPNLTVINRVDTLTALGRCKVNEGRIGPNCFNLRSATRAFDSVTKAVGYIRRLHKFCTPSIDIDGTLRAGETPFCASFGNVWMTEAELTRHLRDLRCSKCQMVEALTPEQLKAIGEYETRHEQRKCVP